MACDQCQCITTSQHNTQHTHTTLHTLKFYIGDPDVITWKLECTILSFPDSIFLNMFILYRLSFVDFIHNFDSGRGVM